MQKVAVVTDSLACLPKEITDQYGISIVPLNIHFNGNVYKDWVDIAPSDAYELFLKDPESWGSSAPSPMDFVEAYRKAGSRVSSIICVTASSKLSTTHDAARLAKEQAKTEPRQISIEVIDSQTATAAEGLIALAAARAAADGRDSTEVIRIVEAMKNKVSLVAFLDTIRYVYRSGRIPKIVAKAGSILNIKPLLTISSGVVHPIGLARSKEQGINRLLKIVKNKVGQKPVHMAVMHAYAPEEAERLKERVASEFNCVELWLTEFSPLMGYACGTGTLGLAFYTED